MHLVLIEDDEKIGAFVSQGLREEGHVVSWARRGDEGLNLARQPGVELAIVDLMLPERDGISIIRALRESKNKVPIIVLSARAAVDDRVHGLEAGADDYLTKPFSFAELLARVGALMRRAAPASESPLHLEVADLTLDVVSRRVRRGERDIDLQTKEFILLEYLMRNRGRVLSKTMILQHVWDYHFDPQTNVVDVLVSRLRSKIDRDFPKKLIHTLRGIGYVLRTE
ncbi:MAG TPA: response regulator transcription factor [Polyangiaceae bacterium]|jgi:DNA-binding response OmpR family regulator|nr:response regulator transcription factor [Polyangiaceae bacterium]